jgi:HAE1 family hydrophobic/amphiphilic exporter-1
MSPRDFERHLRLPRFSLNRRITVLMLALTIAVVGIVAVLGIPAELFPRGFTGPFLQVMVPWADAPPQEVLDKVTLPLEEEISTVRGIDRMASVSQNGRSSVYVWFKSGTDMDVAYREMRDRVERAKAIFPTDIDRTFIRKDDVSGLPIFMIGIAIDPDLQNPYDLIKNDVMMRVERIDGVASISNFGLEEKEILIELDRELTAAYGLNIYELAQSLRDDNFTMASGTVMDGSRKLLLRSVATYASVEELENRPVSDTLRLREIATINYAEPERDYQARVNSKPAAALRILKEAEANTQTVTRELERVVEEMQNDPRLAGLDMEIFFSQGEVIDEALSNMMNSGMIGGLLAAAVLFFFMRRFRLTLIVAFSIPTSMLIGLITMYFAGETLNILTMIGLMVCVGLLVDNSVVVAENIHRLFKDGASRKDACVKGAGEVGLAIIMSTLTTIVVFLPAALVAGPAQFFLTRLAIPIAVSVLGSLLVALVFIPLAVYLTLPTAAAITTKDSWWRRVHQRVNDLLHKAYDASFGRFNDGYNRLLERSLTRRLDVCLAVGALFITSMAVTDTPFVGQQEGEKSQFDIYVELPATSTIEEAEDYFQAAEKVIESHAEEFGLHGWFVYFEKTEGQMQAWFDPDVDTGITAKEAMEIVAKELPRKPGATVYAGDNQSGEEGKDTFAVFLTGEDYTQLADVAKQLEDVFVHVDGVLGVQRSSRAPQHELALVIDREKAQHVGANPQVIAGVVSSALRGAALPKYRQDGKEIPVRVRFQESDRESLSELSNFMVPTDDGGALPLSALTQTKYISTPEYIVRRNKTVGRAITLELVEGTEEETRTRLTALMANIDLPEGISFGSNRRQQTDDEELASLMFSGVLSIVFIYLLMGFLFESFILPMSILSTIPLSLIGVWWIHHIAGLGIDFLGAVACILLVGVVVNNGIVLIDYVNRLRGQGISRREAVLTATHLRFRPIMMTAITTIGGMVPLALAGADSIGLSYTSFAITLIGGMSTATLFTLLVVPVFYTMLDDLREIMTRVFRTALGGRLKRTQQPVAATSSS